MKRFALILALLCAAPAWASVSRPANNKCSAATTSCTLTSVSPGDLIVCGGYRSASTTASALPGNNINLFTKATTTGGTLGVLRVWWRWAASASDTGSGTSTNASDVACVAYTGAGGIGANPANNAAKTSTTLDYPALTMDDTSGASWVLTFAGSNLTTSADCGSDTSSVTSVGAGPGIQACDTGAGVTAHTDKTVTVSSSTWVSGVVEIKADLAACTGAPCPTLVQDVAFGSNDGGQTFSVWKVHLPNPVGASNLLICGASWDTTSVTLTITDNNGGNTWTAGPTSNDGTRVVALRYVMGAAAGTQDLTLTLSTAEFNVHGRCSEFYNVATSSAVDGTSTSASGLTGPQLQPGAITTTTNNDLIYTYGINQASLCCTNAVTAYMPGGLAQNLLGQDRHVGHFAQFAVWGSHGAINPTMMAYQATHDTFGIATIALKAATAGTAPGSGIRVACLARTSLNAAAYTIQFPCPVPSVNLIVTATSESTTQNSENTITDTDSNTYNKKSTPDNSYPQLFSAVNATFTNNNSRTMTINNANSGVTAVMLIYGITGAATSPIGASGSNTGNQTNTGFPHATCVSSANTDSTVSCTPQQANSLLIAVENNGTGPECGMSGTGNIFDATWYSGQNDSSTGLLESSSGFAHAYTSSTSAYTFTWNWANATVSGYTNYCLELKAPAAAGGVRKRVMVTE